MNGKQRLELTWVGKEEKPRLEPRILLEDSGRSYHSKTRVSGADQFDNRLIFGDNLLALKALEAEFSGKIRCIYIDPPYNSGSAFEEYNDGLEHSIWLSLIRDRIELLWPLLATDGSLWISIDDREMPYLRVVLDEICGRENFVSACVWQKRYSRENRQTIGDVHEYILVFAKSAAAFKAVRNLLPLTAEQKKVYKNPNSDPRGPWRTIPITAQAGHATKSQFYTITGPTGKKFDPPAGSCWRFTEEVFKRMVTEGRVYFGKDGSSQPNTIRYLSEVEGAVPWTWWPHDEVGHTDEAMKESQVLFGRKDAFPTPKPERLIERVLQIATNEGEWVLDAFAGSGTTGAVAQKMNRRWLMVEQGEHCHTHIIPRLKKVVDGEDLGGITDAVGWKGGGGFRYFHLAPSMLEKDQFGNWIISKQYNPNMLAEAMCRHMGFTYSPSPAEAEYWRHGHSSERDFIFVTTQSLTHDQIRRISDDVGVDRTLLICCKAFKARLETFPNLTVKKIPMSVLTRCEWGRDDYSMGVAALPPLETDANAANEEETVHPKQTRKVRKAEVVPGLFDDVGEDA